MVSLASRNSWHRFLSVVGDQHLPPLPSPCSYKTCKMEEVTRTGADLPQAQAVWSVPAPAVLQQGVKTYLGQPLPQVIN